MEDCACKQKPDEFGYINYGPYLAINPTDGSIKTQVNCFFTPPGFDHKTNFKFCPVCGEPFLKVNEE